MITDLTLEKAPKTRGRRFDTVREFTEASPSKANREHGRIDDDFNFKYRTDPDQQISWFGVECPDGPRTLDRLTREGWTEGAAKALELKAQLAGDLTQLPGARAIRRKRTFGAQGDELDPHKVNMGTIDKAWTTTRRDFAPGSTIITIRTSIAGLANRSGEELFWKGTAAAILTDILEEAGYRVEIILYMHTSGVFSSTSHGKDHLYQEVTVKAPEEPLDLNRVITCTALAGFFRYYGFKARLSEPYKICEDMGRTVEKPPEGLAHEQDILVNNIYSREEAVHLLKKTLTRFA